MYNDTVYQVRGDEIVPEYFLNLGNFELPEEYRPEVSNAGIEYLRDGSNDKRFAVSFEASEKLFISSQPYFNSDEARQWNMIYDRRAGSGNLVVDIDGSSGMITNDIDGGVDFWPVKSVNDTTLLMRILPGDLIGEENLKTFVLKGAVDPVKKKQFLAMTDRLEETDNPVLMFVRINRSRQ
jgi:hypothetical protein